MVGVLGPRLCKRTSIIKWKLYHKKASGGGYIQIITTEQTYFMDYPNHIHSRDVVLKMKQLLSNFHYLDLCKVAYKEMRVLYICNIY